MSAAPLGQLPEPSPVAKAHSERVVAHVAAQIAAAGGWVSFADYMNAALYAPGLGYYAAGARKFGAEGDFVTAPEMTSLFGSSLAVQLAPLLSAIPDADVLELGPGTARLAADVLLALSSNDTLPDHYRLLELSPDLRERQRERLHKHVPAFMRRIEWLDRLPPKWRGVIVANELLDAVPPQIVVRRNGVWFERGVALEKGAFVWAERLLAEGALRTAAMKLPVGDGYIVEINLAALALIRTLARRCDVGALIVIDYGFPESEFYHLQRSDGTLMAHYRHHALSDPFFLPGLCDLTAHVDFSATARAGAGGGMSVAGYTSQAQFLINCGILDQLTRCGDPQSAAYLREAAAVQTLLQPSEMGELFKVLVLTRGLATELLGFREGDRSHRL